MINPSQRPLPDNTQHSQQTDVHAPVGFEPTISAGERPKTYALDPEATGTGGSAGTIIFYLFNDALSDLNYTQTLSDTIMAYRGRRQTKSVKTKTVQTKNMQTPVYKLKTKRLQITLGNQGYTGIYEEWCNRRTTCNNKALYV